MIKGFLGKFKQNHYGMNIGLGGLGKKIKSSSGENVTIKDNGEFGHLYINTSDNAIQVGFETSAPGKKFMPGGSRHGPSGKRKPFSAFMTNRLDEQKFGKDGDDHIFSKNDPNSVYSWNKVVINEKVISKLRNLDMSDTELNQPVFNPNDQGCVEKVKNMLQNIPKNAIAVPDYTDRNKKMQEFRLLHQPNSVLKIKEELSNKEKLIFEFFTRIYADNQDNKVNMSVLNYAIFQDDYPEIKFLQDALNEEGVSEDNAKKPLLSLIRKGELNARNTALTAKNIIQNALMYINNECDLDDAVQSSMKLLKENQTQVLTKIDNSILYR